MSMQLFPKALCASNFLVINGDLLNTFIFSHEMNLKITDAVCILIFTGLSFEL